MWPIQLPRKKESIRVHWPPMDSITCGVCNWNSNKPIPKFINFARKKIAKLINILKIVEYFYSVKRTVCYFMKISLLQWSLFFWILISRYRATTFSLSFHLDLRRWAIFLQNNIKYCWRNLTDSNQWVYNYDAKIMACFPIDRKSADNQRIQPIELIPVTRRLLTIITKLPFHWRVILSGRWTWFVSQRWCLIGVQEQCTKTILCEYANSCGFNQLVTNVDS